MNWDRYLTLFVAICCLVAVGTAAGTMDASVTTDPDEEIDVDTRLLPIGNDQLWELHTKINGAEAGDASGGASEGGDASARSDDGDASASVKARGGHEEPEQRRQSEQRRSEAAKAAPNDNRNEAQSQASTTDESGLEAMIPPKETLLEALEDLLRRALPLLALLALAGCAAALLRRYGDRLRRGGDDREASPGPVPRGDPAPTNDVSRAWYEMTRRLDLDGRHELTPAERADAAAERGANPEAAASLTRLFEEVRYGGAPVTEERRRRALRWLERLRSERRERERP